MEEKSEMGGEVSQPIAKKNNTMMYVLIAVVAVVLLAGIAFATKGDKTYSLPELNEGTQKEELSDAMTKEGNVMEPTGSAMPEPTMDPNALQIKIEAGSYYYKPDTITAKKGQKIQIVMNSVDMVHNFNIDELDVHGPMVKSGETKIIEFTPEKVGTFEYYCSVANHRAKGQIGKITVTE